MSNTNMQYISILKYIGSQT